MSDDDYIYTPVTLETLEDPDELGIHSLEAMSRRITADFVKSGTLVTKAELKSDEEPTGYKVTFIPKRKGNHSSPVTPQLAGSICPSCGTQLNNKGQCRACWGDVFGLCDSCNTILDENHTRSSCLAAQKSVSKAMSNV